MFGDRGMTPERTLALAGTAGLLIVGLVILLMLAGSGGKDASPAPVAAVTHTPTATATATAKPKPTPPPLTVEQRTERDKAVQYLQGQGFEPVTLRSYRGDQTLRVILGRPIGATEGARRAFFFANGNFVGADAPQPSGALKVLKTTDTTVTLRYGLFAAGDGVCCPSGGRMKVRFQWDGTSLKTLDALPTPQQRLPGGA